MFKTKLILSVLAVLAVLTCTANTNVKKRIKMSYIKNVTYNGQTFLNMQQMRQIDQYICIINKHTDKVSLIDNTSKLSGINELTLEDVAYLCCRGGWPRSIFMEHEIALEQAYDYYDAIVNSDISRVDNITRNPERAKNLMRSYARNIGSQASNETLKNDMINNDSTSLDTDTVFLYVNALKKYLLLKNLQLGILI